MNGAKHVQARLRRSGTGPVLPCGLVALALAFANAGSVVAATDPAHPPEKIQRVIELVRACQFIDPDYRESVSVELDHERASIGVYRNPVANPQDCKIDAVLIAGKVLEVQPRILQIVKVRFYDFNKQDSYWEVTVPVGPVRSYAARTITQKDLLAKVSLNSRRDNPIGARYAGWSYAEILGDGSVVPGNLAAEREELRTQIKALKSKSLNVTALEELAMRCEDLARRGQDADLKELLAKARLQLSDAQARLVEQKDGPVPGRAVEQLKSVEAPQEPQAGDQ